MPLLASSKEANRTKASPEGRLRWVNVHVISSMAKSAKKFFKSSSVASHGNPRSLTTVVSEDELAAFPPPNVEAAVEVEVEEEEEEESLPTVGEADAAEEAVVALAPDDEDMATAALEEEVFFSREVLATAPLYERGTREDDS